MLLAVAAFLLQAITLAVAEARAVAGSMPEPAVVLSETVHFHGRLAVHVHAHGSSDDGHVHDPVAPTHGDNDGAADGLSWTLFSPSLSIVPASGELCPPTVAGGLVPAVPETADGTAPPGLVRPPSTPSIA
jgi:hypothetical protein